MLGRPKSQPESQGEWGWGVVRAGSLLILVEKVFDELNFIRERKEVGCH